MENILEIPQKPPLNEGQQRVHDRVIEYVTGKGENLPKIVLIRGYAGTGKTFTVTRIVESLQRIHRGMSIAATAPTHKAVRVMRKNAELGSSVAYGTIHSLLGLKATEDQKTGKKIFKRSTDPEDGRVANFEVLIVDEVSMMGDKGQDEDGESFGLWTTLMQAMSENGLKLILLGDPVQIPPINEKDSPAFLRPQDYGIEILDLTESMRQAGDNPILDYATEIRNTYKSRTIDPTPYGRMVNDKGIQLMRATQVKEIDQLLEDMFCSAMFKVDADYMKVIAWHNKVVDSFNSKIRRMLYTVPEGMSGLPLVMNGEKLIMDDRYMIPGTQGLVLPNNEEIEVENYEVVKKAVAYRTWSPMIGYASKTANPQIYCTNVKWARPNGGWNKAEIHILHERSKTEIEKVLAEIKKSALATPSGSSDRRELWKHFWQVKGYFADVKYNYAVTAHKSQGSTYENCMLVKWDIDTNPNIEERNRITYVGATRAKHLLYIIQ